MRPPPRGEPFTDFDELAEELAAQFNGDATALPDEAKSEWSEAELQMFFASGGQITPPPNPKLRAAARELEAKHDLRSPAQIEADAALELAREAAQKAPWWEKVTELDRQKAGVYRDAALARGIPDRPHGLIPADDPHFRQLHKAKHILPFEKHILFWESSQPHIKGGADGESRSVALHADEGYTHGDSACAGRGLDLRYFWDSSTLKVVAAVAYSQKAVGGWSAVEDETSTRWRSTLVHGGLLEAVLDELTAEVMKINIAPDMVTSEMTVRFKKPSSPGVVYKAEAAIVDVSPPLVTVSGRILTQGDEEVITCTAKCAMLDRLPSRPIGGFGGDERLELSPAECLEGSCSLQARAAAGGGGGGGNGAGGGGGGVEETLKQIQALQASLVAQLQGEYFCDDVEPPPGALGWEAGRLREYFEAGGA
mmetsp:Transcript_2453/g.8516  ORF Transcript_2453/g.8516 Transcript_2453/m.8516 type:complete len:425 (+) Transcript_2453:56-1330(+)